MYPLGCIPRRVRVPKKRHFFQFWGVNDPLTEKIKIRLRKDLAGHRSMCCSENFVKIGRREVGEIVRGCVHKKVKFFGVAEGRFPVPLRPA